MWKEGNTMIEDTKKATVPTKDTAANENNIQVNNSIVCQGMTVDADYLQDKAVTLTNNVGYLQLISDLLGNALMNVHRNEEMDVSYFLNDTLPHIDDALRDIAGEIQRTANGLCPDD